MSVSSTAALATFVGFVVSTAVALHVILEILNPHFDMLSAHLVAGVLVAVVAGVFLIVVVDMAGRAGCVLVAVEQEELGRQLPVVTP